MFELNSITISPRRYEEVLLQPVAWNLMIVKDRRIEDGTAQSTWDAPRTRLLRGVIEAIYIRI